MARSHRPALLLGFAILCVAIAFSLWPQSRASGAVTPVDRGAQVVRVTPVEVAPLDRSLRLPGVTRAARRATLSFTVPARLADRPVEVGDTVHAGEVLATLDDREFLHAELAASAALAEVEARRAQAERDLERSERLAAARAATREELEQARAAAAALEAAQQVAEARLEDARRVRLETRLAAPFDAAVTAVHLEPGEWASPGAPVVELSGRDSLEVEVEAPETVRSRIPEGSEVSVELPFLGLTTRGRVKAVAAAAAPGGLFPVTIALTGTPEVVAGLAVEVALPLEAESELCVPLAAVVDPGSSRPSVFRIADGIAERVAVRPGRVIGDRITVEADLASGQMVAVAGHTSLVDGDRVEVR